MLILTIRTDNPQAEIGLYENATQRDYLTWHAHRQLAETIHTQIKQLLAANKKGLGDLEAIAVYQGPGSFTGLRIGVTVANALAQSLQIPVIGTHGEGWTTDAIGVLRTAPPATGEIVTPEYGAPPHITAPKK